MAATKKRMRWMARRGMKELDMLLLSFVDTQFDTLDADSQRQLEMLLNQEDPTLYAWLVTGEEAIDPALQPIVKRITTSL